ncbi:MAG: pyruvate flavodoxin/ferredoxin oxidoreductase [Pseudomonadota bacterium]
MKFELCSGNRMAAWGAMAAGCRFFAGYPITPSSEIYSEMMKLLPAHGGVAVGTPDEITALNYVAGASMAGARAMTATSGPGWCLMIETFQFALMTETPLVVVLVQRLGPATGGATQGGQGDLFLVEHATSGGYTVPVLAPVDAVDCYELTAEAFRLSEQLRTPVVVLSDKEIGMSVETIDVDALPAIEVTPRKSFTGEGKYLPYGIGKLEDVPLFSPVGGEFKATITGSAHNQAGELRKNDPETIRQLRHLEQKIVGAVPSLERVRLEKREGAKTLLVSFGVSARTCRQVVRDLRREGKPLNSMEVLSLFPVPVNALASALSGVRRVVVVEENLKGMYAQALEPFLRKVDVVRVNTIGEMISPEEIRKAVLA